MVLSSIQKRRSKSILIFDNSEQIIINYEVYLNSGLYKGDELNAEKMNKLLQQDEFYSAKNSAFRFLGNRNHSSFEIKQKLRKKGHSKEIIDKTILDLKRKGFIEDRDFAESFVNSRITNKKDGIIKIRNDLIKKGVNSEIISEVLNQYVDAPIHIENAIILATNKYKYLKRKDLDYQKLKGRLFTYLKSKGFTSDIIFQAIDKIIREEDENDSKVYQL